MRIEMNPQKMEKSIPLKSKHRVIIVVFVPEMKGYYANIFEVLKICIQSCYHTINNSCKITVVNNGSCKEVQNWLNEKFNEGVIDTLIHHSENIGKMDALIGAARGAREQYITLSDTDILFTNGWQNAVEKLLDGCNEIGSVSPIAVRNTHTYTTFSVMGKILMRKFKFSLEPIEENFESNNRFYESINWTPETDKTLPYAVLRKNDIKCLMGSTHQILTVRRQIIMDYVPKKPSLTLVGSGSEINFIDLPIDFSGKMRVSTYNNYAYHMGNNVEKWMIELYNKITIISKEDNEEVFLVKKEFNYQPFWYKLKKKIVKPIFSFLYLKS